MSKQDSLTSKTVSGVLWSTIERFSIQTVMFVLQIIMARLLTPADYGVIGMLAVFMAISQSFIDSGFSNALIRKTNRTETDYCTVFYFNLIVGALTYFCLYFFAPYIASFYNTPLLHQVTRVISLNLVINSLIVVHRAKLTINIDFKSQAKVTLSAAVISGTLGIYLAYAGYGVWALVYQTLANSAFTCIFFWCQLRWIPRNSFSYSSFKEMFSYGSKLLISGLLETAFRNIYTIVIGKKFSATDLGYYSRADTFAQFGTSNFTGIMQRVTFPILSSIQDDNARLAMVYRKYLRLSAFIIFPLAVGLASVAEPFITLLIGKKWLEAVPLLQIVSFAYMWYPVHSINLNLLQVKGRSDLFLKLEIFKKMLGISILIITLPYGIKALCAGQIISSFLALILNTYYTDKLIKIGFFMQMRDLFPSLIISLSMGLFVYYTISIVSGSSLKLLLGISAGGIYYLLIGLIFGSQDLQDILSLLKTPLRKLYVK